MPHAPFWMENIILSTAVKNNRHTARFRQSIMSVHTGPLTAATSGHELFHPAKLSGDSGEGERRFHRPDKTSDRARVASAIDLAHAARAGQRDDLIRADFGSRGQTHFFTAASQFVITVSGVSVSPLVVF